MHMQVGRKNAIWSKSVEFMTDQQADSARLRLDKDEAATTTTTTTKTWQVDSPCNNQAAG